MKPKIVAHRGYSALFPENTIPAFKAALNHKPTWGIETDLQLSKDHVPVLFHDKTVKRLTGSYGSIREFPIKKIKSLHIGQEKIPLLEETLKLVDHRKKIFLEIKDYGFDFEALSSGLSRLLSMYQPAHDLFIHTSNKKMIEYLHKKLHSFNIGFGFFIHGSKDLQALRPSFLKKLNHLWPSWAIKTHYFSQLKQMEKDLFAWTIDGSKEIKILFSKLSITSRDFADNTGLKALICNDPAEIEKIISGTST